MINGSRFPIRSGNWNNGSTAGLGALNLNNVRSNSNSNIGSRSALENTRNNNSKECCQCAIEKDATTLAIAKTRIKPLDASRGCLFAEIYSFDNLIKAAYLCRKNKTTKTPTLIFFNHLEENIIQLQNELMWGMYEMSPYHHFYVFEPKRRLISAPNFRDRVVHRAMYNVLEPLFDKRYIYDSYACRTGKGTHKGADRAQRFIRDVEVGYKNAFAFKADISRYFSSIDHAILKELLSDKVKCQRTLTLLFYIIDNSPCEARGVGIPLGNLTSQLFANIYLHELDVFVKHELKAKRYIRYMDDFVIIHHDKQQLQKWRVAIEHFLYKDLKLKTNSKTQVFPISKNHGRALDFLGYRIYSTHKLLRKCSVNRIKTKLKIFSERYAKHQMSLREIKQVITSWLGHAKHASTTNLTKKLLSQTFKRD